jgi:hypothetical protein
VDQAVEDFHEDPYPDEIPMNDVELCRDPVKTFERPRNHDDACSSRKRIQSDM